MPRDVDAVLGLLDVKFQPAAEPPGGMVTLVLRRRRPGPARRRMHRDHADGHRPDMAHPPQARPREARMSFRRFDSSSPNFTADFADFLSLRRAQASEDVYNAALAIVKDVRSEGRRQSPPTPPSSIASRLDPATR